MKQLYFIGSGFSVGIGYPPNQKLLDKIREEAQDSSDVAVKEAWSRFEKYRLSNTSFLKAILESSNPELILTVPDLLIATLDESYLGIMEDLKKAYFRNDQTAIQEINKRWDHPLMEKLTEGQQVRQAFQRLLDEFFSTKHYGDSLVSTGKWVYVQNAMKSLGTGSIVITTNWDSVIERALLEQGKWFPSDGYGFNVNIIGKTQFNLQQLSDLTQPSQVKLLKLHGSLGWLSYNNNQNIYLRSANYLQFLHPVGIEILDKNEENAIGSHDNFVFVGPSYLKKLEGPIMQSIWQQAAEAIASAEQVTIVGYSLPYADIAVRVLLNPLRKRLSEDLTKVKVVDPNKNVLNRWHGFLGPKIERIYKKAEEFFNEEVSKYF